MRIEDIDQENVDKISPINQIMKKKGGWMAVKYILGKLFFTFYVIYYLSLYVFHLVFVHHASSLI